MTLALISDIHANLEALEAVLQSIEKQSPDEICCLGDVVGYGCNPVECVQLVEETCRVKLMGNHEHAALGRLNLDRLSSIARSSIQFTQDSLDEDARDVLSKYRMEEQIGGVHLVHASPHQPETWQYILTTAEAERALAASREGICFVGHTHLPMIFSESTDGCCRQQVGHSFVPDEENRYIVNIGSVGQPRDGDPRACYATFDTESLDVTYHRVAYDVQRTQEKLARANIPQRLIDRIAVGR